MKEDGPDPLYVISCIMLGFLLFLFFLLSCKAEDISSPLIGNTYSVTDPDGVHRCDWTFKEKNIAEYDYATNEKTNGTVIYGAIGSFDTVQITTKALGKTVTYRIEYQDDYIALWPIGTSTCYLTLRQI